MPQVARQLRHRDRTLNSECLVSGSPPMPLLHLKTDLFLLLLKSYHPKPSQMLATRGRWLCAPDATQHFLLHHIQQVHVQPQAQLPPAGAEIGSCHHATERHVGTWKWYTPLLSMKPGPERRSHVPVAMFVPHPSTYYIALLSPPSLQDWEVPEAGGC